MAQNERPGVMLYFDIVPALKHLTLQEKGALFDAILNYSQSGELPDLKGAAAIAWDFMRPKLDRDAAAYQKTCQQKRYAVFCREIKKWDGTPMPFDRWVEEIDSENNRLISGDIGRYPTTATTAKITTTATAAATATALSETDETEKKRQRILESLSNM